MSDIKKGKITEVKGYRVRVATEKIVTPLLPCEFSVDIGDVVAYTIFSDGTGVVLARCE